jgi:hypothetical protein
VDRPSWQIGVFDRMTPLLMLVLGVLLSVLVELAVLIGIADTANMRPAAALFVILGVLLVGIGIPMAILRMLVGIEISPEAFARSRRQQQKLLEKLGDAEGSLAPVVVRAAVEIVPSEAFDTRVWSTPRGWYWRVEDAWALARFHSWAANHAVLPTRALHMQRMSVLGGVWPDRMRGMRLTETTRRLWWIDAWRSHRQQHAAPEDVTGPERAAGLVYIPHQQLREAGLTVEVGTAQAHHGRRVGRLAELQGRQTAA